MRLHTAIAGTLPKTRRRPARRYRQGRVCADEGCATILSRYNAARYCSIHESAPATGGRPAAVPTAAWRAG